MLKKLLIENYALIDNLEIEIGEGLSVITGETGAGKSILLGALSLILGQRADTSVLLDESRKCVVEGHFFIKNYNLSDFFSTYDLDYEELVILRREIAQNGKTRAFINDTPVNLATLKELTDHLINIHSQHSIITLNDSDFQLAVLDGYAGIHQEVQSYRDLYQSYLRIRKEYDDLVRQEENSRNDRDYNQFLFDELNAASLLDGEQEELESRIKTLEHAEEIKSNLQRAIQLLTGEENNILNHLSEVIALAGNVSDFHAQLPELSDRLKSNLIDLKDINHELDKVTDQVIFDPEELERVSVRLDLIYRLEKKHHSEKISELIFVRDTFEEKIRHVNSLEDKILASKKELETVYKELFGLSKVISEHRSQVRKDFEKKVIGILATLGMPDAAIKINHEISGELTRDGVDRIRILFSANKGIEPDDISKIASGGELSRLMLSIKSLISQKNLLPTIIFDEIDSGVSGEVAAKVGSILRKMSEKMQVIAITHLPQIAGMGDTHFWVYKIPDGGITKSRIRKLAQEERVTEIAKMLGSGRITDAVSRTAEELLDHNLQ